MPSLGLVRQHMTGNRSALHLRGDISRRLGKRHPSRTLGGQIVYSISLKFAIIARSLINFTQLEAIPWVGTEIQRLIIFCLLPLEAHETIGETSRYTNNLLQCANHLETSIKGDGIIYN